MSKEDKCILLQDLTARLSYGVILDYSFIEDKQRIHTKIPLTYRNIGTVALDEWHTNEEIFKPYLRPMSSMTEEEKEEVEEISHGWFYINEDGEIFPMGRLTDSGEFEDAILPTFEYFLKHHFDYRGLIEKGLALEALEGMYNV